MCIRDSFDTNPGALHIVMANELGLRQQAFGIDAENTRQKWNQPVHHFESVVLAERAPNEGADPRAVRELVVRSEITWTQEIEATWEPVLETPHHSDTTRVHSYTLELDAEGTIVGGQWVLLLESGEVMTFHEVFRYFQELDENNDGQPDLDDRQASEQVFRYFEFPDYVWTQERGVFSDNFQIPPSEYSLVGSTRTSRGELYDYMGRLGELL